MYIVTFNNYIMALKNASSEGQTAFNEATLKVSCQDHAFTFLGLNFTFILSFTNIDKHIFLLSLTVYCH